MNERIDGYGRWQIDPYGSETADWDPVAGVQAILSDMLPGQLWAAQTASGEPSLPGLLDSRLLPPPAHHPVGVLPWSDFITNGAEDWTDDDSAALSCRDLCAAAERLNEQIPERRLAVPRSLKDRIEALYTEEKEERAEGSRGRPVLNGTVFFAPLGTPPPGGFELRTCCPQFMEGDTHNPSCYRTLEEVQRMVPANRSGGYDDGPRTRKELREEVLHKLRAGGSATDQELQVLFEKDNESKATSSQAKAAPYAPPPIPDRLRIGHLTYTVTVSDAEINKTNTEDKKEYAGFSTGSEQRIVLREDNPPDYQAETLLHEILHQCLRVTGTDPDADAKAAVEDVEERAVSAMAGPLLGVLRDHPELLEYLTAPTPRAGGD